MVVRIIGKAKFHGLYLGVSTFLLLVPLTKYFSWIREYTVSDEVIT